MFKKWAHYLLIALPIIWYIAIIVDKARFSSFTHDESGTYLHYCHKPFLEFFTNMDTWDMANNHLLNTFLINISTTLFGVHEWSLRLPNILAGIGYALSIWFISRLLKLNSLASIVLFAVMALHPLLVDLFTVARGYGLCLCLCSWSSYYLLKYYQDSSIKNVLIIALLCTAAVYANFIAIPYFIASGFLIILINLKNKFTLKQHLMSISSFGFVGVLCLLSIVKILFRLSDIGEFKWGTPSLKATCTSFVTEAIYEGKNYGSDFPIILSILFLILFIGITILLLRTKISALHVYLYLLIIMIALPIFFHYAFNANYPDARKTILYYPLFGIAVFSLVYNIPKERLQQISLVIVLIFFTQHFGRAHRMRNTREWWYDKSNKLVIDRINASKVNPNPKVACNWLYMPALEMYRTTCKPFTNIPLIYNKGIDTVNYFDYYYVTDTDTAGLMNKYYIDEGVQIQYGQLLLRPRAEYWGTN